LWHWFESGTPIPGANSATYAAIAEGVYTIEYTSNNGCVGVSEPTTLSIQTTFEAHIRSNIDEPCVGETVVLSLDGNYTNVLWSNGDSGIQLAILEGGDYTAFVTNNLGCTAVADTTIAFAPLPFIDAGEDIQYDCSGPALPLVESDGTSFLWTPNYNVSNDTLMIPELSPTNTTRYTITATLGRCTSSDNVSVITDCSWIYIPTAFTPDFDGVNDAFKAVGHGISKFEITIFNRWGDPVYFSTDMDETWVGGEGEYFVSDGVYTYKLIALDQYGVPILGDNASFGTIVVVR
jgi:gliding motility-associated-like protein